jgi:flagellar motility protein MotE (MotC chaperone)
MTPVLKKSPHFIRLLPSVMVLGVVVWGLKAGDLVHEAYAQGPSQAPAISGDPVPANKDYAGGEGDQVASASEVDVVNSLSKRRRELDKREGQLTTQANMIAAAEQRVDAKIAQLKQLQAQITQLLGQRDEAQKAQIAALVKTYSTMKPKDAARIFNDLPDDVLVPVAREMKSDQLALVLASMSPDNAKSLTVKLANRLILPQATAVAPAASPAPAATTPAAPVPAAAKAPVTGQNQATPKT